MLINEYKTRDYQLLAIEIKRTINRQNVLRDLAKLAVYCKGGLKYKKGILILVNANENRVRQFPHVNRFLTEFPELEIWIVRHGQPPIIICRDNI